MGRLVIVGLAIMATTVWGGNTLAGDRPIIAVFDVEAQRLELSGKILDALADYLATRLTESGRYQVVPRDQLRARLNKEKRKSYKLCYDQSCQIEMGRELAAEKTLATQVIKFSNVCTFTLTIYDLKRAATELAATSEGNCDEKSLLNTMKQAVQKLVMSPPPVSSLQEISPPDGEDQTAIEWLRSKAAGIELTRTEITVAQYHSCIFSGKCTKPVSKNENKYCNWDYSDRGNHPINCVTWTQAQSFCRWSGGRLPTEEEWYAEASRRGRLKYPWGNQKASCKYAVMDDGESGCGNDSTRPVCSKPQGDSVSGLCDMSGNVWEWTSSGEGGAKVVRGGSWGTGLPKRLLSSSRKLASPAAKRSLYGFRCGRAVK